MNKPTPTCCLLIALVLAPAALAEPVKVNPQDVEFFEKKVRPVLAEHCYSCHGPKRQQAGLRLDSRAALVKGSDVGPVVVAGDPDKSLLVQAVRYQGDVKMPPKNKLPSEAAEALAAWVKRGLPWPDSSGEASVQKGPPSAEEAQQHWAFRPIQRPVPPNIKNAGWAKTPLDRFILAKLEDKGLTPTKPADRRTLLRRATLDLVGLPPTPDQLAAFEADESPDAFARVIDRLLTSPHYGERWGRHWLDVARYSDTKGYVFQEERRYPFAYTYRDYVIRSFNEDLPYDQFIVEQLAADRLPLGEDRRALAAMGYLTLGRRFLNNVHDIIDDRIDVVSRGLMGLTVSCARCHDHKFDPIPQKDYYSLYGVFASSQEPKELPAIADPTPSASFLAYEKERKALQQKVQEYEEAHKAELQAGNRKARNDLRELQKKVDALRASHGGAPAQAMVLVDAPQPTQPRVFVRGNANNRGDVVPRQFLAVLSGNNRQPFRDGSGRLELARAIASKDNPLTARVLVNRVWLHHFGAGLVRTPGDFGLRGDAPTHPELLDYLAASFMEEGWSIKQLHRRIMLSAVYQQSSTSNSAQLAAMDPDNHLLGRMNRQRLDFEALRDSLLAVTGRLDTSVGGRPVDLTRAPFSSRRSVYGLIDRQNLPGLFRTFDFASPDTSTSQRYTTTVPQQALFLMNSPFVVEQARRLIARAEVAAESRPEARIDRLYRLLYGRAPDREEMNLGRRFVESARSGDAGSIKLSPWEQYAQVLLLGNEFAFVD